MPVDLALDQRPRAAQPPKDLTSAGRRPLGRPSPQPCGEGPSCLGLPPPPSCSAAMPTERLPSLGLCPSCSLCQEGPSSVAGLPSLSLPHLLIYRLSWYQPAPWPARPFASSAGGARPGPLVSAVSRGIVEWMNKRATQQMPPPPCPLPSQA